MILFHTHPINCCNISRTVNHERRIDHVKNLKKTLGCLAVMNAQRFRIPLIRKTSKEALWNLKGP